MHEFKHPKYYKELRQLRNKLDQSISPGSESSTLPRRSTGPGLKVLSTKLSNLKRQATSRKPQAPSDKHQAPSDKPQA